jgi:hypothetical protein
MSESFTPIWTMICGPLFPSETGLTVSVFACCAGLVCLSRFHGFIHPIERSTALELVCSSELLRSEFCRD